MVTDLKTLTLTVSLGLRMSLVSRHLYGRDGRETVEFIVPCRLVLGMLTCLADRFRSGKTLHFDKSGGGSVRVEIGLAVSPPWL